MSEPAFRGIIWLLLTGLFLGSLQGAEEAGDFSTLAPVPAAVRLPWTRGGERFQRQWLVLGPLPSTYSPEQTPEVDPGIRPTPGQPQVIGSASSLFWTPLSSWTDVVDLSESFVLPRNQSPTGPERVGYAFTTVTVDHEGPWDLSLGFDGSCQLWVNGESVPTPARASTFVRDALRLRVHLMAGANRVLLRLSNPPGPWLLALRVVALGAVLGENEEISPTVSDGGAKEELVVRTDSRTDLKLSPVEIVVFGAGGKTMGSARTPRGENARFPTSQWPVGAYEVRCATQTAWGEPYVTYLPWYHGDISPAVQRLDAAVKIALDNVTRETLQMLAAMVRDRLGKAAMMPTALQASQVHAPLLEFEEWEQLRSGGTGPIHGGGFVRLAYVDPVDDSVQFCRAYLPPNYDPAKRWPLIIQLHGFNPRNPEYINWWSADQRHSPISDRHGAILLEPHGRGNAQYAGIGEADVLRALVEAKRRFSVDEDRVSLTGESMGGHGTWYLAARHPELFAAAAPVYGGWDFRLIAPPGTPQVAPPPRNDREAYLQEVASSFTSAEALSNLPLYVHHGDNDQSVDIRNTRHVVGMLQRWGYNLRYREHVGLGHEDLGMREEIADWLLAHRRLAAPRSVRLRAIDLRSAASYWLRVEAFEEPSRLIVANAEVVRPGMVSLDTNNVTRVSLQLPKNLQPSEGHLTVIWNGRPQDVLLHDGCAVLRVGEHASESLQKQAGREGPISDIIRTPFAVVVGTASSDPIMRLRCEQKAEAFRKLWNEWQHHTPRVIKDRDLSAEDEKQYSLLLIGGADANSVTRRLGKKLPLDVSSQAVTIDGKTWPVTDGLVQMIYASPFASDRYVMVVAGTSPSGLFYWTPNLWFIPLGFNTNLWDWMIQDGRRVSLSEGEQLQDSWVASGVFDARWRRDERWTTAGSPDLRARSPLRSAPKPDISVPAGELSSLVGRYEVSPWLILSIQAENGGLSFRANDGPSSSLLYVDRATFAHGDTGAEVIFERTEGKSAALTLYDNGQVLRAKRIP